MVYLARIRGCARAMKTRTASWLAWFLCVLTIVLVVCGVVFTTFHRKPIAGG